MANRLDLPATMPNGVPWPKISIVTPSYNQGDFLEETIRSVLLQGYPNLEYIIMDGGSTDQSVEIIRKYEPWLAYWVSEPDGGQASAINHGWSRATGEAITWLNSDDTLEPNSLAAAATVLYSEPDIELVFGRNNIINAESQIIGRIDRRHFSPEDIIIRAKTPFPQPGFLMKRQLLDRFGMLDESMRFCMDFDYWTRLAIGGIRAEYVDSTLANFRDQPVSKSNTMSKTQIIERLIVHEKAFSNPQLKLEFQAQRKIARSFAELKAGSIAYHRAKDPSLARKHLWQHIRTAKFNVSLEGLTLFTIALGGKRGLKAASWLYRLYRHLLRVPFRSDYSAPSATGSTLNVN